MQTLFLILLSRELTNVWTEHAINLYLRNQSHWNFITNYELCISFFHIDFLSVWILMQNPNF